MQFGFGGWRIKHMQLLIDASNDEENWDKQRKEHEIKGVNIARKGITAKVSFMIAILRAHTPGKEVLLRWKQGLGSI